MKFDRNGDLFAFGYTGAMRLHVAALDALESKNGAAINLDNSLKQLKIDHFTIADGLPDLEFHRGVMLDQEGRIWAANVGGATLFDPSTQPTFISNPPLYLHHNPGCKPSYFVG